MTTVDLLRAPISDTHDWLEATMSDVTPEQAHWQPPGIANPIAAVYAHVIVGADVGVNTILNGQAPLIHRDWNGTAGLSELMPVGDWHGWAKKVRMDLDVFRRYARSVYDAWGDYLDALQPADLERPVDLSAFQMGQRSLGGYLAVQIEHFSGHCGEIACLKGLQGVTGYRPGTEDGIG